MFYVRDHGEGDAVLSAVNALSACLEAHTAGAPAAGARGSGAEPAACTLVPGLELDQYVFTLVTSVAGGVVAGFASQLPPDGIVRRQWVWLLVFSPLWGILFVSFGLAPVLARLPAGAALPYVLGNTAGFLGAGGLVKLSPMFARRALGGGGGGEE